MKIYPSVFVLFNHFVSGLKKTSSGTWRTGRSLSRHERGFTKEAAKKWFLVQKISEDPLEKFFGCQRQRGRVNENPTVTEFCKNTQKLQVINSVCLDSVKGNCRGKNAQRHGKKRTDLCLGENIPSRATQNNCTTVSSRSFLRQRSIGYSLVATLPPFYNSQNFISIVSTWHTNTHARTKNEVMIMTR